MRSNPSSKTFPKLIIGVALLVIGLVALLGWNYYQNRYPSWDEEVRLSDGRVITIHQKRQFFDNYGTNQSWVTIDLPELGGKQVWHSYLIPMRVDVDQGKVYVFGRPRGPRQVSHYRYPKNHMVAFVFQAGEFQRIPFLKVPEPLRVEENVYSCLPPLQGRRHALAEKHVTWCEPSGDANQFVKKINLPAYQKLAIQFAELSGGLPISD
jgi:hypothetical protein